MYIIFPFILLLLIICALLMFWRKKAIIRKLCCMPVKEKLCRLNELIRPFGFEYLLSQDIFTSLKDAWQRDFGYCWLYDKSADLFNMVFDCEPVYFDHKGCTWMIELWKDGVIIINEWKNLQSWLFLNNGALKEGTILEY